MGFRNEMNLSKYASPIFFETGTFFGGGTKVALRCGFKKVITIELQEYIYNQVISGDLTGNGEDLVKEITDGSVQVYLGDSRQLMWKLIEPIEDRITFWLDAHIDGGNYRQGQTPDVPPCPLLYELEVIGQHKRKDHIILIDDLRIMGNIHSSGYGWGYGVYLDEIQKLILKINPLYQFKYEDGHEPNDILVAYI